MSEEDLPQDLTKRIVTTDAAAYMAKYDLNPHDYDWITSYCSNLFSQTAGFSNHTTELYKAMAQIMQERGYIAVTDARLSEVAMSVQGHNDLYQGTLYGTAIARKQPSIDESTGR